MEDNPTTVDQTPNLPVDRLDEIPLYLQQWFPEFNYTIRDRLFFAALHFEYPAVDLLDQLKTFHAWCLDRKDGESLNYRVTFRRWIGNANKYRRSC